MSRRIGFVLAGGGTKGAFEVGAVGYLVGEAGLEPTVITAASAGSIVGAKLAQARGTAELVARADELRHDLLAMTDLDAVFGRQPWLADLEGTPLGDAVSTFVERRPDPPRLDEALPGDPGDPGDPGERADGAGSDGHRRHHRGKGWRSAAGLLGALPELGRARRDLPGHLGSILTLDPLGRALRGDPGAAAGIEPLDPALVARPGLDLRLAVTALGPGVTRYVTGDGTVVEADARTPSADHDVPVDLVEAVLTSSSAPMVFPARMLGGHLYSDGGVARNLPVDAAVALGATDVVAVLATPLGAPRPEADLDGATLLQVHLRAMEIGFFDQQRRSLVGPWPTGAAAGAVRVRAVAPTVDLVGAFEVNEGLMRIDMDYGWLRAQEATADLPEPDASAARRLTDRIVVARDRAWFVEEALWRGEPATLADVQRLKQVVADALARRAALGLAPPEGAEAWSATWEAHAVERPDALPDHP